MRSRKLTEEQTKAIETERVAWVVGQTDHGALSYVPGFGLSYDGCPEWLEEELQDAHGWGATFCTVVTSGGGYVSGPSESIQDANGAIWDLVGTYTHAAEAECPVTEDFPGKVTRDQCVLVPDPYRHSKGYGARPSSPNAVRAECPMCGARIGEEHGFIYIGEGFEAVYKLREESDDEE